MSDYFSNEILVEILHRLPIKSLLKYTSVCKSWRSLITHPSFISHHLHYSNNHNRFLLTHLSNNRYRARLHCSLRRDDDQLTRFSNLRLPTGFDFEFHVVGICNGLLCITNSIECYTLFVCNPCIRRYVTLPQPHRFDLSFYKACVGFGFDSVTNDYKVVRIACAESRTGYGLCAPYVEIYSLETGVWRDITAVVPMCTLCFVGEHAPHGFVDGVVHWGAYRRLDDHWYNFVLSFDFRDETFGEVTLPQSLAVVSLDTDRNRDMVTVVGGGGKFLTVYHVSGHSLNCSCNIWVMKEYGVFESWNKLFTFNFSAFDLEAPSLGITLTGVVQPPAPILFRNSGELLLFLNHMGKRCFYLLDAENNRFTDVKIGGEECTWLGYSGYYAESLVLLNKAGLVSY